MIRVIGWLLVPLCLVLSGLAGSRNQSSAQNIITIQGTSPTSYMLDGQPAPTVAVSLRRLLTSYSTNKLVNLRRTSDSTTTDIGFLATGAIDTATASTFCNATTCFVTKWYDQSGGTRDLSQATAGNQPAFIFNCLGTNPCIQYTTATQSLDSASFTPTTGVVTFGVVANRAAGTGGCRFLRHTTANTMSFAGRAAVASNWTLSATGQGTINSGQPTDAAWHSGFGVINGAGSLIQIDALSPTTGTVTGFTGAGTITVTGIASTTCDSLSAIFWDAVALSATAQTMIGANQRAWWGF